MTIHVATTRNVAPAEPLPFGSLLRHIADTGIVVTVGDDGSLMIDGTEAAMAAHVRRGCTKFAWSLKVIYDQGHLS